MINNSKYNVPLVLDDRSLRSYLSLLSSQIKRQEKILFDLEKASKSDKDSNEKIIDIINIYSNL